MANPFIEPIEIDVPEDFEKVPYRPAAETFAESPVIRPPDEMPKGWFGRRAQDIVRGTAQLGQMAGGLGMLAGVPGSKEFYQSATRRTQIEQAQVPSFTDIAPEGAGVGEIAGNALEYITSSIFEQLPLFAVTLPSGVAGMAAGAKAFGAPVFKEMGKQTARGLAAEWIEKYGVQEAAKKIAIRKDIGALAGSWASSTAMEAGSIAGDIQEKTGGEGMGYALMAAPIAGIFNAVPNVNLIKNVLGRPVAEKVVKYAVEKVGTETAKQLFMEAGTEGIQTIIERTAVSLADPKSAVFGDDGWKEVIDAMLKGGAVGGAMGGVGEIINRSALKPSADPLVNAQQQDIENRAKAKLPIPDPEDLEAASQASGDVSGSTIPTEGENKVSPLEEQKIIVTDKLKAVEANLDTLLTLDEPKTEPEKASRQTKIDDLNNERSRLKEQLLTIQSTEQGYDPNKKGGYMQGRNIAKLPEDIAPETVEQMSNDWMDTFTETIRKTLGAEDGQTGTVRKIKAAFTEAVKPLSKLMAAGGVKINFLTPENAMEVPTKDSVKPYVSYDAEGNITLNLPDPEQLRIQKGESIEDHIATRIGPQITEESDHVKALMALKNQWREEGKTASFESFMDNKIGKYADSIRRMSSNKTIQAFATAYTTGDSKRFDITPDMTPEKRKKANAALANEFIRAVFRKMRDGTLTEETQALYALEQAGNAEAGSLLDQILQAIQVIKDALVNFINPKTAPKDIKELISRMNVLEDQFVGRKKAPPRASVTPRATNTLPAEENPATGQETQTQPPPEAPADEEPQTQASAPAFISKVRSDFFQTPGKFYRVVVGDNAFQDIVRTGNVRTNATGKIQLEMSLAEKLAARPTAFPSFSKDAAAMYYASENPNHYIIVTEDASIQPSKTARHGKGTTYFPTDAKGNHLSSLDGSAVSVYRHEGGGNYSLVYDKGKAVESLSDPATGNVEPTRAEPEARPTEQTASAPAFISKAVEQQLADLGYPRSEINKITPADAQDIIENNRTFIANDNTMQSGEEIKQASGMDENPLLSEMVSIGILSPNEAKVVKSWRGALINKSSTDVINAILASSRGVTRSERAILSHIRDKLAPVKFMFNPDLTSTEDEVAVYSLQSILGPAFININPDWASGRVGGGFDTKGLLIESITHELIHHATLENYNNPRTESQRKATENIRKIFAEMKGEKLLQGQYALTDETEFIAELMSNTEFQSLLKGLDPIKGIEESRLYGSNKNLFDQIVSIIGKLLGMPDSALDQALRESIALMGRPSRNRSDNTIQSGEDLADMIAESLIDGIGQAAYAGENKVSGQIASDYIQQEIDQNLIADDTPITFPEEGDNLTDPVKRTEMLEKVQSSPRAMLALNRYADAVVSGSSNEDSLQIAARRAIVSVLTMSNSMQSGEDLPRFTQYFEARDRNNEIVQDNIPITVNAESPEQAAEKATQTPKYQDLKKRYKGKVYSKGSPILVRPEGAPGDLGMGTQDLRRMQSGEDIADGVPFNGVTYRATTLSEGSRPKMAAEGALGSGIYLSKSRGLAEYYLENDAASGESASGRRVAAYQTKLQNPLVVGGAPTDFSALVSALTRVGMDREKASSRIERDNENRGAVGKWVQAAIQKAGYDSLVYERKNGDVEIVSYNPENVTEINPNNIMQSGADMPKWEREVQDELIEPFFAKNEPNQTKSEKRKSKAKAAYLGPNLTYWSRPRRDQYDRFRDFMRAVGPVEAFRRVGYDNLGAIEDDYKVIARTLVAKFLGDGGIRQFTEMIPNRKEREAIQAELFDILAKLNTDGPGQGTELGRGVSAFAEVKRMNENGDTSFRTMQNIIMDKVMKAEPNWTPNEFAMILERARDLMFKGLDKVILRKDFLARLSKLIREATKDPEKLLKDIKASRKRNREAAAKAAKQAAMRAGEEYFDNEGENLAKLIASKISKMLSMATPEGAKETNILQSALTKFAKDKFGITPPKNPKIKDKNLRILQAIMASKDLKTQFIDELESQLADKFIGSSKGSWEGHKKILDDMREAGWSDDIRDNAIKDIQNQLQVTIANMISNGWEGSKEKIINTLKDRVGEIGSPEMLETLYDEVEQSLDDQAAEHLDKTFGYKRGEDGKIIATDKGRIAGAPGMAKVLKQWGVTLRDLTRQNIILRDQVIDANAKSFVAKMGLPEDMAFTVQEMIAQELKDAVEWTKESEIAKKVQALKDKSSDKSEPTNTKNIIDKIVELGNQGFLDELTIYEAIRQNYKNNKLPPFNKAVGEMVRRLGNDMAFMDDGITKNEIRQAIANQLANMSGITWGELATSYWYFALLSGPSTQGVNLLYNFFSTVGDAMAMMTDASRRGQHKKSALVFTNLIRSISPNGVAAQRFLYTMQSGMAPTEISSKFGFGKDFGIKNVQHIAQLPFERITEEEVSKQTGPFSKIFYTLMFKLARGFKVHNMEFSARNLSRFMMATDMFFRTASRDAALGYQGYGDNYKTIFDANLPKAKQMAGEGASQAKINAIADELVMKEIGSTKEGRYAVARAEQIGLDTVAAGEQKGLVGALAKFLAAQSVNYPFILRPVVPFTGIVAGVWNNSLNYTPWGAVRWLRAKHIPKSTWAIADIDGNMIPDDLQMSKAFIGTLATGLLAALFADPDDDWEIYGTGPKDPADRKAFFAQGKKPFHIRIGNTLISYQFLGQLSIPLGILGTFQDTQRDRMGKQFESNAQAMAELGAGLMAGTAVTMINQSFVSSVANLGEAMFSNSPADGVLRWAAGLASSPMPNIMRQITNDVWTDKYRSSSFLGQMAIGYAVTKNLGTEPALNIYGDQLKKREMPVIGRFTSTLDNSSETLTSILDLGLGLPVTRFELEGVPMTDQQQTQFVKIAGPRLKAAHEQILPTLQRMVNDGNIDKAKELLSDTTSRVNRDARRQMVRQP